MLPTIARQVEELKLIGTCFSHATDEQFLSFVLFDPTMTLSRPNSNRIAPVIQLGTTCSLILATASGIHLFIVELILLVYD